MHNIQLGKIGEEAAAYYLQQKGYRILKRNYRCKRGELDLIAVNSDAIHFVEVKTRESDSFGLPSESVTRQKQNRMKFAAGDYLSKQCGKKLPDNVQFDVIEIKIDHIENI